jgi:flagellar protein FliO/FliZ
LKRIALVLCAVVALGAGAVAGAQGRDAATQPAAGNAVGTASSVDETTLSLGDAAAPARAAGNAAGSTTLSYFLRMVFVLAIVLAAIYGVYRLMKRASRPKAADNKAVKVLATTALGPGKALHIVVVGSKAYLIGATDSSISLVSEVADKDLIDTLSLEAALAPKEAKPGADFGEMLAGLLTGRRRAGLKPRRRDGDFLAGQRERLRKF